MALHCPHCTANCMLRPIFRVVNTNDKSACQMSIYRIHSMFVGLISRRLLTTQQLQYAENGDPTKVLKLTTVELADTLEPCQVRVKWEASPINPADINQIQGIYPLKPPLPAVGGNEGVGRVEMVGAQVTTLWPGDLVLPLHPGLGCWRRIGVHENGHLVRISADLPLESAATLMVNPSTAYRMLNDFANLQPGDCVLQNGANSAVGRAIIQIAKTRGLLTINLVRDRPDLPLLISELKDDLGADHVLTVSQLLTSRTDVFSKIVPKLALNCVGGRSALIVASSLCPRGIMVTYGGMSRQPVIVPTGQLIFNEIKLVGFWMSHWYKQEANEEQKKIMFDDLTEMIKRGQLKPPNMNKVPLDDFESAVEAAMKTSKKQLLIL